MKIYFRLLKFAQPVGWFLFGYIILSLLGTIFGIINFSLLIPLLNILFNVSETAKNLTLSSPPQFSVSVNFFKEFFNYYFDLIIRTDGKVNALWFVSIVIVISVFLSSLFKYAGFYLLESLRARTSKRIRSKFFSTIINLHIGYFSDQRKGDIISRATNDMHILETSITKSLFTILKEPLSLISFFVVLFAISVRLTFFTILIIPVTGLIINWITSRLKKYAHKGQMSLGIVASILDETIGGLRIMKGFHAINYINEKFDKENNYYTNLSKKMARLGELSSPVSEVMGVVTVVGILLYGGILILENKSELTPSEFVTYIILFSQVLNPIKNIATEFNTLQKGVISGKRILEILETPSEITNIKDPVKISKFRSTIEFKSVSFKYEKEWVLKDINFIIPKGKTIALVGSSGSGKSTIADLLTRFYDVQKGEILLDNVNIKNYELESLINQLGVVSQESILFNDSIFNNIAFGNTSAMIDDVINAAKIANAHDFIIAAENGYDTIIGDRGVKLSGGQRQRLSIARAIFKNPPILILDEATSALDTESEKLVQEALANLMQNRTSLVIAHRLSTIQHADEILVIQNGEIVERGTHKELLENSQGIYRKLSLLQNA